MTDEPAEDTKKTFIYASSDGTKMEVTQSKEALDISAHIVLGPVGALSAAIPPEFFRVALPALVAAASHFTRKAEEEGEKILGLVDLEVPGVVKVTLGDNSTAQTLELASAPGDSILLLKFVMPGDLEDPENPEHWWNKGLYALIDR